MIRLLTLTFVTGLLAACTWNVDLREGNEASTASSTSAEQEIGVSGQLFYPERIALPSDAEMRVVVRAVDADGAAPIAGYRMALDGGQVPLPFALSFRPETGRPVVHQLQAWIVHDGRVLRRSRPMLLDADAERIELARVHIESIDATDFGRAWHCGPHRVRVDLAGDRPRLAIDGQAFELEPVPAASGAKFQVPGDEGTGVHEKGGKVQVFRSGTNLPACREASQAELPLTALGHEPAWKVEIEASQLRLLTDYGQSEIEMPRLSATREGWTTRHYGADDKGAMIVSLHERVCADSATGMPHPFEVHIQTGLESFRGCGGRPARLLTAGDWRIERIDGVPIETEARLDLRFSAEGRVGGNSGCNSFTAAYRLTGEGLQIDEPATTLMACPEGRMALERRILERIKGVHRFEIDERGGLVLVGQRGSLGATRQAVE